MKECKHESNYIIEKSLVYDNHYKVIYHCLTCGYVKHSTEIITDTEQKFKTYREEYEENKGSKWFAFLEFLRRVIFILTVTTVVSYAINLFRDMPK